MTTCKLQKTAVAAQTYKIEHIGFYSDLRSQPQDFTFEIRQFLPYSNPFYARPACKSSECTNSTRARPALSSLCQSQVGFVAKLMVGE